MLPAVCARLRAIFGAGIAAVLLVAGSARAQETEPATVGEMPIPGGLPAALAALGDPISPNRAEFLLEIIRRSLQSPSSGGSEPREAAVRALIAHLETSRRTAAAATDTVPLPLAPNFWIDGVFGGRATKDSLADAILSSRNASLLYYGLLSLDEATRGWLAGQRELLSEVVARRAAPLMLAAPALRIEDGAVGVPGGEPAEHGWEELVGKRVKEPVDFVRALLTRDEGRLASFFGAFAPLTPAQIELMLDGASADATARSDVMRRLYATFERLAPAWKVDERPFWRPTLDPALLAADLRVDENGRPQLPRQRRFWNAVFDTASSDGGTIDFAWLSDQVFRRDAIDQRRRYYAVLFASRNLTPQPADANEDAIEAVRGVLHYPALIAALERAHVLDIGVLAAAVRRASQLSSIPDEPRARRALAQFQGMVGLFARGALRGSVSTEALAALVSSLARIDVTERGDYEGRLVRWLDENLPRAAASHGSDPLTETTTGIVEQQVLRLLAGPVDASPRYVEWEGTRYRIDFGFAEATRIARMRGENARPSLTAARTLVGIADELEEAALGRDGLQREAELLGRTADGMESEEKIRAAAAALQRTARDGDIRAAARLAPELRLLADDLLGRGAMEFVYAVAMGQPDRSPITAAAAAARHEFDVRSSADRRGAAWRLPFPGDPARGWHMSGSILGLDAALAEFSLMPLSAKPPARRPTLNDDDRQSFVRAAALLEPRALNDGDRDTIVEAIGLGRTRRRGLRSLVDARAIAAELRLTPLRTTLLGWTVQHDLERLNTFLSHLELLWLGLKPGAVPTGLQAWGAPAEPRLGCLCLQLTDRRPWDMLAGRWTAGILATAFPDLNLRLAELLADLDMPAALLAPVLASATLDFVNNVTSRDPDDHRALVEFVQTLRVDRAEQYLALLTTDGPLVPVDGTAAPMTRETR